MDEHEDAAAGVTVSDADVVEPAVVPDGEFAVAVDAVFADAVVLVDENSLPGRAGVGAAGERGGGGAAVDAAVRALGVVVGGEGVQLGLQVRERAGAGLAGQPFLQRLVEAFDLAAGGGVIRLGVPELDAEGDCFAFQGDPAVAAVGAVNTAPLSVSSRSGRP